MANVVFQQSPRRRPSLPARCTYVRGLFDQGLKVAEIIEKLDAFDCSASELQWVIDNAKGKARAWAKRAIKALEDPSS